VPNDRSRVAVGERLRACREEIEQAALTRVRSVSDPSEIADPEYLEGLRVAVSAAIDFGLAVVERGEAGSPPLPAALLIQARLAARNGVSLDTVLRRYFAGYGVLGDFIMREAGADVPLAAEAIHSIGRDQAVLFDRLLAAVTEEYTRESKERPDSAAARNARRLRRLLAGELLDTSEIAYEFDVSHVGMVGVGSGVLSWIREFAKAQDRRLLVMPGGEDMVCAWLGGRRRLPLDEALAVAEHLPPEDALAFGEPAEGLVGWRLTHSQAMAALPVARRGLRKTVRYADVALVASMLRDELLCTSLRKMYLAPLSEERDGGAVLWETLSAYFAAGRNISSAAAALGVSRRTVANRLRTIEARLDRPIDAAMPDLEAALRLRTLDVTPTTTRKSR
jgi:DNA-binding PucR family transcriptional regulator